MTGNWNTWAMLRSCGEARVTSRPSKRTVPCDGVSRPDIRFSKVVLPQPDGPSSAKAPPSANSIFSGSSA
jgi:hypothetical protein